MQQQCATEAISDIKFSPDGQTLAVASHDNRTTKLLVDRAVSLD
jgi:WD40 repeat protein